MEINRIRLGGIRNIQDVNIDLEKIISLLSINSYGKSNYLNGIIFGIDFIHAPIEVKNRMMDYDSYKPLNKNMLYKDFSFEIEFTNVDNDEFNKIIYGYVFSWKSNNNINPKIIKEYLKIKEKNSQKYVSFIKRDEENATFKSSPTASCIKKINIDTSELLINKLLAYDNLYFLKIIKQINDIYVYVDRHFNTNNSYDIQPFLRKNFSDYSLSDDTNVPRILFKIKKDYPNKYDLIVNTLKDIFTFIKDIQVLEYGINSDRLANKVDNDRFIATNMIYLLFAVDENLSDPIEFSNMSDGVRRVLLILTTLVLAELNDYSLVAIEEPENSLNPKILQRYLMTLNGFAKNTKIIITSHSPYLVNYLNPRNIYLGLPNNNGIANFSRIREKSINKLLFDAKNMDMLVGDYIFSLMSGDDNDLITIANYVE